MLPICRQRLSLVAYEVLKNQVLSSLSYSATLTRDAAIFTIAGVTLDAYILALPLDAKTKARVIAQLSNPTYSIPLDYFLRVTMIASRAWAVKMCSKHTCRESTMIRY